MFNTPVDRWNQTYSDCAVIVKGIAELTRFREFVPLTPTSEESGRHLPTAEAWMVALEWVPCLLEAARESQREGRIALDGLTDALELCRDSLFEVWSVLRDLEGTDEFEALRRCMAAVSAGALV